MAGTDTEMLELLTEAWYVRATPRPMEFPMVDSRQDGVKGYVGILAECTGALKTKGPPSSPNDLRFTNSIRQV